MSTQVQTNSIIPATQSIADVSVTQKNWNTRTVKVLTGVTAAAITAAVVAVAILVAPLALLALIPLGAALGTGAYMMPKMAQNVTNETATITKQEQTSAEGAVVAPVAASVQEPAAEEGASKPAETTAPAVEKKSMAQKMKDGLANVANYVKANPGKTVLGAVAVAGLSYGAYHMLAPVANGTCPNPNNTISPFVKAATITSCRNPDFIGPIQRPKLPTAAAFAQLRAKTFQGDLESRISSPIVWKTKAALKSLANGAAQAWEGTKKFFSTTGEWLKSAGSAIASTHTAQGIVQDASYVKEAILNSDNIHVRSVVEGVQRTPELVVKAKDAIVTAAVKNREVTAALAGTGAGLIGGAIEYFSRQRAAAQQAAIAIAIAAMQVGFVRQAGRHARLVNIQEIGN